MVVGCSFKEEQRIREKRFEKYRELLADYYYRSDHVGMDWEEAMDELDRWVSRA